MFFLDGNKFERCNLLLDKKLLSLIVCYSIYIDQMDMTVGTLGETNNIQINMVWKCVRVKGIMSRPLICNLIAAAVDLLIKEIMT